MTDPPILNDSTESPNSSEESNVILADEGYFVSRPRSQVICEEINNCELKYPSLPSAAPKPLFYPVKNLKDGILMLGTARVFLTNILRYNGVHFSNADILNMLVKDGYLVRYPQNPPEWAKPIRLQSSSNYFPASIAHKFKKYKEIYENAHWARVSLYYVTEKTCMSLLLDMSAMNLSSRTCVVSTRWSLKNKLKKTGVVHICAHTPAELLHKSIHISAVYEANRRRQFMSNFNSVRYQSIEPPVEDDLFCLLSNPTEDVIKRFTRPQWMLRGIMVMHPLFFVPVDIPL